jgi:hypothetical protein
MEDLMKKLWFVPLALLTACGPMQLEQIGMTAARRAVADIGATLNSIESPALHNLGINVEGLAMTAVNASSFYADEMMVMCSDLQGSLGPGETTSTWSHMGFPMRVPIVLDMYDNSRHDNHVGLALHIYNVGDAFTPIEPWIVTPNEIITPSGYPLPSSYTAYPVGATTEGVKGFNLPFSPGLGRTIVFAPNFTNHYADIIVNGVLVRQLSPSSAPVHLNSRVYCENYDAWHTSGTFRVVVNFVNYPFMDDAGLVDKSRPVAVGSSYPQTCSVNQFANDVCLLRLTPDVIRR